MKTYRVYFKDGNQKLYRGNSIQEVIRYIEAVLIGTYTVEDVYKIEEVTE